MSAILNWIVRVQTAIENNNGKLLASLLDYELNRSAEMSTQIAQVHLALIELISPSHRSSPDRRPASISLFKNHQWIVQAILEATRIHPPPL